MVEVFEGGEMARIPIQSLMIGVLFGGFHPELLSSRVGFYPDCINPGGNCPGGN